MRMLRWMSACLMCWSMYAAAATPAETGVVFLHGKESSTNAKLYSRILDGLRQAGFRMSAPEMTWSRNRIYDTDVEGAMQEIDRAVKTLREAGAQRVVIVGHSMGANGAIRYAATRTIDGIVTLAPGHQPEFIAKQLTNDVARAREMIAQGKGQEKETFRDVNVGHELTVNTTAAIYLSWLDPAGDAVMPANAAKVKALPVLMVVGSKDPVTRSKDYIFGKFPEHAKSRFVTVDVDHREVPDAAVDQVVEWIKGL